MDQELLQPDYRLSVCKHIVLRLARIEDSDFVLKLRLNEELNRYVSKVEDDLGKQQEWMRKYKEREKEGIEFYFIIESGGGERYGTVRVYDFKPDSFCWGSWMIQKGSPSYVSIESALSVYEFAFDKLGFTQSHFDVDKENQKVLKFHQGFGAKLISSDDVSHNFVIQKEAYEKSKKRYRKFLRAL